MLVELAIGDAYGAGFEFADENQPFNTLESYVARPSEKQGPTGIYTDDTQMSIGIAELLVEGKEWNHLNLANKFIECFKRDPVVGYARRFYDFLRQTPDGATFLKNMKAESERSGAAMRATPIGVFKDRQKVLEYAEIQAKLTHNTPNGIYAAQAAALMTHYFLHVDDDPYYLPVFIADNVAHGEEYDWLKVWEGSVGIEGWQCVLAAITAVSRNASMSDCLKECIAFTGDVDTVATLAMAATSCCCSYTNDLPQHLYDNLTNHTYGRVYLEDLDRDLMDLS